MNQDEEKEEKEDLTNDFANKLFVKLERDKS
uniref:Uncharacterized protein n=1 Tax=Physcomitrium patens TaxID=3218 RepID=A0A2K1ICJ5_PHYPA|nr:hypothetical protein PHYPA_030484 [Physcomitrium patens]